MSLTRVTPEFNDRADYLLECNGRECKGTLDIRDRTFTQAVTFLKAKGWHPKKERGTWMHYCSEDCDPHHHHHNPYRGYHYD